jgi:DDE domain
VYHSIGANLGKWCYLYQAIDHDGNLVDSRLSEKRDMDAARQFFTGKPWLYMLECALLEFHHLSQAQSVFPPLASQANFWGTGQGRAPSDQQTDCQKKQQLNVKIYSFGEPRIIASLQQKF